MKSLKSLLWMSQRVACPPARYFLYHAIPPFGLNTRVSTLSAPWSERRGGKRRDPGNEVVGPCHVSLKFPLSSGFSYVSLLDNNWHHACFMWENIDGNLTLYIDGLLIGQKQGVHPGLTFDSKGTLVIGQLQREIGGQFIDNESYLGDITDVNVWSNVSTNSIIQEQSRECFNRVGDLLAWPVFSIGNLQFLNEADSIPTECRGFGKYKLYTRLSALYQ